MALQKYQEDHMDEMEIINLHKKCNKKVRKVSQSPKKALWDTNDPSEEPKKADGKRTTTKAGALQPKKPQKTPEFVNTDSDDSDNEQETQKSPKTSEFLNTNSDD